MIPKFHFKYFLNRVHFLKDRKYKNTESGQQTPASTKIVVFRKKKRDKEGLRKIKGIRRVH